VSALMSLGGDDGVDEVVRGLLHPLVDHLHCGLGLHVPYACMHVLLSELCVMDPIIHSSYICANAR
jgi:hypothetical protein